MYANSRSLVRRQLLFHHACTVATTSSTCPSDRGCRLISQTRRLGLHDPPQDDAWRRSPSLWLLAPCPGFAGRGSAGRRHELNHGGQTAQILALFPRLWVLRGHGEEGHRRSVPAGSGSMWRRWIGRNPWRW
jgi:hypothetical protein